LRFLCVLTVLLLASFSSWAPTCALTPNLVEVAQLSPADLERLVFGDTDHDGHNEVLLAWHDQSYTFFYSIYEEQGNNVYTEEYRGAESFPLATADLDGDGKSDLVGQWGSQLQVYESTSAQSYPTELVWTYPVPNFIVPTAVADTDRDGKMEIIYFLRTGVSSTRMTIFECAGDNDYRLVYSLPTHNAENPIIGDFDGDGRVEIAYCGQLPGHGPCSMTVVESDANDSWNVTFTDSTGLTSGGDGQGGRDTDGNGRVELFFAGFIGTVRTAVVYEPVGDNAFRRVTRLYYADQSSGIARSALGNIDGVGPEEYLVDGFHGIQVFRPVAPGEWLPVALLPRPLPVYVGLFLFDVNQNGIPELFRPSSASDATPTLVFEQQGIPTSLEDTGVERPNFIVSPNPSRGVVTVLAPGAAQAATTLYLFDVAGRLVDRTIQMQDSRGRIVWSPRLPSSGVYLLRLETARGGTLETRRVTFIR